MAYVGCRSGEGWHRQLTRTDDGRRTAAGGVGGTGGGGQAKIALSAILACMT